jgi:hypothetical protein
MTWLYIAIVIGLAAVFYFVVWPWYRRSTETKRIWNALDREAGIPKHNAMFKYAAVTPGGVQVRSTVEVPASALPFIDEGIDNQIKRHNNAYPHWAKYKNIAEYKALFVEPTATNQETEPGSPAIHVKGYQSAGTCIGTTPLSSVRPSIYIVLPHQKNQGWRFTDYLMRSAWHESEHVREFSNDLTIFQQYANAGDIHPHVP